MLSIDNMATNGAQLTQAGCVLRLCQPRALAACQCLRRLWLVGQTDGAAARAARQQPSAALSLSHNVTRPPPPRHPSTPTHGVLTTCHPSPASTQPGVQLRGRPAQGLHLPARPGPGRAVSRQPAARCAWHGLCTGPAWPLACRRTSSSHALVLTLRFPARLPARPSCRRPRELPIEAGQPFAALEVKRLGLKWNW